MTRKNRTVLIIVLALIAVLVWVYDSFISSDYDWSSRSFHHEDRQPYGCMVFDSLMSRSLPNGYQCSYASLGELRSRTADSTTCFMLLNPNVKYLREDLDTLLEMANRGATFMIAAHYLPDTLTDLLHLKTTSIYSMFSFSDSIALRFVADSAASFVVYARDPWSFKIDSLADSPMPEPIVVADSCRYVTMLCKYGKGTIILSAMPQLFTNCGIMRDDSRAYVLQMLGYISDKPVVRTEFYNDYYRTLLHYYPEGERPSLFSVLMQHRGTRWAFILLLLLALLYLVFTAIRRQKPIPVIKPPQNRIMPFVRSIAGLYLQRNSNANILLKKRLYWADALQRSTGINVADFRQNGEIVKILAEKANFSPAYVQRFLARLFSLTEDERIPDQELERAVKDMDRMK